MFKDILNFIDKHNLLPPRSRIILGLSGGPDSVFLLHLLADLKKQGKIDLIAAHLDHEWRSESAQDAAFCKKIADDLGIPFVMAKASDLEKTFKHEGSQEELGRNMRRYFLENVKKEHNADRIALAHHLQDQEETFFIRLLRGATLQGLCAMWPQNGPYIRPLLQTNKTEIVDYLKKHNIDYLTDPTNIQETYLRNRIRSNVLPALRETDDRFDTNFLKTINHLQNAELFLEKITHNAFCSVTEQEDSKSVILIDQLLNLDPFIQKRVLIEWLCIEKAPFKPSEGLLDEILKFAQSPESKTHEIHHAWVLVKKKNKLYIKQA